MWRAFLIFAVRNPPFGEFDKLPVVKRWNYSRRAWKIIGIGVSIAAVSAIMLLLLRPTASLQFGHMLPLFVLLVGFIIAVAGVSFLFMRGEIRIDQQSVAVDRVHLWKHCRRKAPLADFHGIALWADDHAERQGRLDMSTVYKLYSVVLLHPDPKKTVWLYTSRNPARARELWSLASKVLNLQTLGDPGKI